MLVTSGLSSQGVFSPDGEHFLFVSSNRASHKQAQIYEKDLNSGAEKRITFQNGSNSHPRYSPIEQKIIYASSTDELKESPPMLNPVAVVSKLPAPYQEPMEVYVHSLAGFEIIRVTNHVGFDGEPRFSNNGHEVVWTQVQNQRTKIYSLNLLQRNPKSETFPPAKTVTDLGKNPTQYVIAANSKMTAWVDWDETFGVARLMFRRGNAQPVELASENIVVKTDVSFSTDSNWLVWVQIDPKKEVFELWIADTATLCARAYKIDGPGERRDPSISPDLRWLTYTLITKDKSRIARTAFQPPKGECGPQ
jgi:Tol biopolymer transport system component